MTSCYGTYTVVGTNIKREMVLSPNDEEVANSSKKHTQLKTRRHKPYPVSDRNGRNWYPITKAAKKNNLLAQHIPIQPTGCIEGTSPPPSPPPLGEKLISLAAYASEANNSGALTRPKHAQQSTMGNKIWKTIHPRKFGYDIAYTAHPPVHTLNVSWCQVSQ